MNRREIWLADVGGKPRPVVVLTRDEVLDVHANVTVDQRPDGRKNERAAR